ncbi:MAG: hypothetical protein LC794_02545 [Acidobacteria bacterium]|nr:hypothetical protein [Acidobacteriota bacterium]
MILLVIAVTTVASARTFPLEKITRGSQEFFGNVTYEVDKAYAGNHHLELMVSLSTKDRTNLELREFQPHEQAKFGFTEISKNAAFDQATGLQTTDYKYLVDIPANTEPRIYLITVTLGYPNDKNINRTFWLYVGVKNKGKLTGVNDPSSTTEFFTGTKNTYRLELENNFTDYPVNIRLITVKCDPQGLIEKTTIPIENVTIDARHRGGIDVDLKAAPMSFSTLLSGFSNPPELIFQITYDDSYGRVVTDLEHRAKIKIRPRDRVLVIAMFIGVVIGAVLKLYLQRLQQQGLISRREVVMAVTVTSLIGLVVSFVAIVGKIQVVMFQTTGSYDNPGVIFIISMAAAVGGAQLLSTFFKSGAGSGSSASSASTSATSTSASASAPATKAAS